MKIYKDKNCVLVFLYWSLIIFFSLGLYSQTPKIDSLKEKISIEKNDTSKIRLNLNIAYEYSTIKDFTKSKQIYLDAIKESYQENYVYGVISGNYGIGRLYKQQNEFDSSLYYLQKALPICKKTIYLSRQIDILSNIASVYYRMGIYSKSCEYFLEAANVSEKLGNKIYVAGYLGNAGAIFQDIKEPQKAIFYINKALAINREIDSKQGIAINLVCLGNAYMDLKQNQKALELNLEALKINEQLADSNYLSNNLSNIGINYTKLHDYNNALIYYNRSFNYVNKYNVEQRIVLYHNLGELYTLINKNKEAESNLSKAEALLRNFNSLKRKADNYRLFYTYYKSVHNTQKSLGYLEQYYKYRDSILNNETNKKIMENQLQFDYQRKATADSVRIEGEKKLVAIQLKEEKTKRNMLYAGMALIALFAIFMVNRFIVTNKQKKIIEEKEKETLYQKSLIEEKHKEITDSINYAERIQRSFLATTEILNSNLNDYFILFKPKDVVSGDFYWAANLMAESNRSTKFILATADSTGHGVPGAIMSLLNITSLESAIKDGYSNAADILNATRQTIIERLKKDGSAEGGKDGMDCSLCIFDFANLKLQIAAAHNPVWIVRRNEVIEIKADKMPVGKHDIDYVPFSEKEVDLLPGDVIFTLTDGFPDQFGGNKGKKFMSKNLRLLLASNAHLPMPEQKKILEETYKNWTGDIDQVDDITIIGIRV